MGPKVVGMVLYFSKEGQSHRSIVKGLFDLGVKVSSGLVSNVLNRAGKIRNAAAIGLSQPKNKWPL